MKKILITGACGYIGSQLGLHLSKQSNCEVYGIDVQLRDVGFEVEKMDIRAPSVSDLMQQKAITHVVHLASIVNPGNNEALEYDIDVNGTANLLKACAQNEIKHLTVTSSGAAYGYYPDNPEWISESDPIRGNEEFSYSRHKRLVEELLTAFNHASPGIGLLIMRPCTVLGKTTRNRITQLFDRSKLLAVGQSDSPFVFIWDQDVVQALAHGVTANKTGAYNLAGDGKLPVQDLAAIMNKGIQRLPAALVKTALWIGKHLSLTPAGPEQVKFLQYRPVLSNERLKEEFGYTPQKSSRQVFEYFWQHREHS